MTTEASRSNPAYFAPEFRGETQMNALLDPACWIHVPRIRRFRIRQTDNFLTAGDMTAMAAHKDGMIYIYAECDRDDGIIPEMRERYTGWTLDNALEIFIESNGTVRQFVLNARGALCCYNNEILQEAPPEGIRIKGRRETGKWKLVIAIPLSLFESPDLNFNLRFMLPDTFSQYCEMNNGTEKWPMAPLRTVPAMTHEECMKNERDFNSVYRNALDNPASDPDMANLLKVAGRCKWDITAIQTLYTSICARSSTPEKREKEYVALRKEYSRFLRKLLPEINLKMELAPGPLTVDFSISKGRIRAINGTNLGPRLSGQTLDNFNDRFKALRFSCMRTHDAPLDNPGMRLGDTSLIFANWHDDPSDPQNYYFEQTDDYLLNTIAQGTDIVYRLGVSIEHSIKKYAAVAPEDYAKFAEICAGVIRHYNKGWADGYHLNIKYWEVWNEPDCVPNMWEKSMNDYYEMYAVVAKRLKSEFPEIRIGGLVTTHLNQEYIMSFLGKCITENAPVDFISWHKYGAVVRDFVAEPFRARALLDAFGFRQTELHLNEWHYLPCSWSAIRSTSESRRYWLTASEGMQGIDSGVFNTTVLTRWQDTPLDLSNYYATGLLTWGLRDVYGGLNKNYYSFLAFGKMLSCPERAAVTTGDKNITLLAGHDGKGDAAVLISCFKDGKTEIELEIKGIPSISELKAQVLDASRNLEETGTSVAGNRIALKKEPGSAIFLLTFRLQ